MFLGIFVALAIAFSAGAAVDNQYPQVGEKITQQDQTCAK